MKQEVRDHDLWAAHLGPELGGKGYGQLKLALLNEILGRLRLGTHRLRDPGPRHRQRRDHRPLRHRGAEGEVPPAPAQRRGVLLLLHDRAPGRFGPQAVHHAGPWRDGDDWVINGWKFFSSNARTAAFLIVMAITDPDVSASTRGPRCSWSRRTRPGVDMVRHVGLAGESEDEGMHALIHYNEVRVPAESLLGGEGQAFAIAQTRLGGGRVHHAMRSVATCQKALDLMCERVLSRETQGSLLARKEFMQGDIADSYAELQQFRLLVLYTAWEIDQYGDYQRTRKNIAAIKVLTPKVVHDAVWRSMHAHGALGVSNEMPFGGMWMDRRPS